MKVLLIRLDKIGDLICTLCVDQIPFLKDHEVQWAIAKGLSFVPDNADPQRKYIELSKDNWQESLKALRSYLQDYKPDVAVSFQAPWWVNYALWRENVPTRAGVLSQWHSFLFLNKGLRQRRSLATQHEADYNLELLLHAFSDKQKIPREETPVLKLIAPENPGLFVQHSLKPQQYVVVHAGMAGSALNWPTAQYIEFIEQAAQKLPVVLTGTPADEPWLTEIKAHFQHDSRVVVLQNKLKATELMTILKNAKAVVAPSTGVAHIAASLGGKVLGLYSPLRVQHPRRWAARGDKVQIFLPRAYDEKNLGPDCMKEIAVSDVIQAL